MSDQRWSDLPDAVRDRIARGEVPPPRTHTDAADPIRDIKVGIAIAEANGDTAAISRMQAEWLSLARRGVESSWESPNKGAATAPPATRDYLMDRARKAEEAGDHDTAHALKVRAMHAPSIDGANAVRAANAATDPDEAERLSTVALRKLRGEPEPLPPAPTPAQPQTAQEFNNAIAAADADGDTHRADRLRLGLLALTRSHREGAVSY